ncbi:DUF397 domain-containing protein [Streptomyces sp. ST2-7A]|uniref:DUF397 domain-containing protein n=1 Tax=Streptomyces sp. ST2-7A TaxID=2907214 RepID=UPI001F175B05|nr:DUF397 domain-containing protein [Streptomyces sp. ST2-7A]MCE7080363.1 DUF397 domain-containing protein [Streptomyces sp. ST2-7A]
MRTIDLSVATWRKSTHSNSDGGACVEVSDDFGEVIPVRDGKNPNGGVLLVQGEGWAFFVSAVQDGRLSP